MDLLLLGVCKFNFLFVYIHICTRIFLRMCIFLLEVKIFEKVKVQLNPGVNSGYFV